MIFTIRNLLLIIISLKSFIISCYIRKSLLVSLIKYIIDLYILQKKTLIKDMSEWDRGAKWQGLSRKVTNKCK